MNDPLESLNEATGTNRSSVAVTPGNGYRTPDDRQSIPKPNPLPAARPPRDNPASREQTKRVDGFAIAPNADLDGLRSPRTSGRQPVLPAGRHEEVARRGAKKKLSHARSRMAIKLFFGSCREGLRVSPICCLRLVEQGAQGGPGARVVNEALPGGVAIQFGQQLRQGCHQFLPFRGRQVSDCSLNLLHRAHGFNLFPPPIRSKRAFGTKLSCRIIGHE